MDLSNDLNRIELSKKYIAYVVLSNISYVNRKYRLITKKVCRKIIKNEFITERQCKVLWNAAMYNAKIKEILNL